MLEYLYCHQMTAQTHPTGDRRVAKKIEFSKLGDEAHQQCVMVCTSSDEQQTWMLLAFQRELGM